MQLSSALEFPALKQWNIREEVEVGLIMRVRSYLCT